MNTDGVKPPSSGGDEKKPEFDDPGRIGKLKEQMYSRATQPAKRPRRELAGLQKDAPDDWQEQPPPPKKEPLFPRSYSLPSIFLVIAALVFVIAGGVAVSFLVSGSNVVTSQKIDIAINGPRTIDGGEVLELQIAVRNNNNAQLETAELVITYPKGTEVLGHVDHNPQQQRVPLGTIEPGGTRNGTVRSIMFGREAEKQDIEVSVEYRLSGSSALFASEAVHTILVASGTLEIGLTTNEEAVAGQSIDMTVTVTSHAETVVKDAVLRASYPFGFSLTSSEPKQEKENLWSLGDMEPGDTRVVRIVGQIDGQSGDERTFRFVAGTRESPEASLVDVVLADFEKEIAVTRPFLDMSLDIDEAPVENYVAQTGDTIPITLNWRNNLDTALTDVVIAATVSGPGLDPFNITADRGFFRSVDSLVLWDKTTTRGALELVPAKAEGQLVIRLTPKRADDLVGVQDPTIKLELHAAGQRLAEGNVPEIVRATVSERIKLATDVTLRGRALYFENPLGSVGPLPPRVEHETTYGVLWELTNSTNLVRDSKVTAVLPPYVRWLGTVSPSVEHVTFNENNGTVTWHVGKLLPDTGVGGKVPRRVAFSIGLVPSTSQVGETPPMVLNQRFEGVDNFVDKVVVAIDDDLTTQLNEVDFADIYGVIVP